MKRFERRRAIVLGGAGFLGSHLCERLLSEGADVVVSIDNLSTGSVRNETNLRRNGHFRAIRQDVTSPIYVDGDVDYVFNLASPASRADAARLPIETLRAGSLGTEHGLQLARVKGAVFVQASSSAIYGDPPEHPQSEGSWGHVNPIGPRAVSDESGRYGEALVFAYRRTHGVDTRLVRLFNAYGPRMRAGDGRVVPAFIGQCLRGESLTIFGDGSQTRSFCFVTDLVEGLLRVALSEVSEPVNLGHARELTVLELAQLLCRIAGLSPRLEHRPLPPNDPRRRQPDLTRARGLLAWEPQVSLEEGLEETLAWFRDMPEALRAAP